MKKIITDVLMIAFIMLFPHFGGLPMYVFPFVVLAIIWLYLKVYRQHFIDIGFTFRNITLSSFLIGAITGIGYAAFAFWILSPLITKMGFRPPDLNAFASLKNHLANFLILMALAWLIVIPFEEIAFRGFIFSAIKSWFKTGRYTFLISSVITSVLFALYHYQEGAGAVLEIFIFGLFEMWLFRRCKYNLWYLIFFHIWYDTFMLTAI